MFGLNTSPFEKTMVKKEKCLLAQDLLGLILGVPSYYHYKIICMLEDVHFVQALLMENKRVNVEVHWAQKIHVRRRLMTDITFIKNRSILS